MADKKSPRLLQRGDFVQLMTPQGPVEGLVAGVTINVLLDAGRIISIDPDAPVVTMDPPPPLDEVIVATVEEMESDEERGT